MLVWRHLCSRLSMYPFQDILWNFCSVFHFLNLIHIIMMDNVLGKISVKTWSLRARTSLAHELGTGNSKLPTSIIENKAIFPNWRSKKIWLAEMCTLIEINWSFTSFLHKHLKLLGIFSTKAWCVLKQICRYSCSITCQRRSHFTGIHIIAHDVRIT